MKTSELMIGNYVMAINNYEDIFYVNCIYGYRDLNITSGIYKNYDTTIRNIKPIPLTEEWLLKFGFLIIEINGKFEATLPNFRYNIYWNKYTDGFLFCDGETVLIHFNYVHELQNLVFVLGQRELTVA